MRSTLVFVLLVALLPSGVYAQISDTDLDRFTQLLSRVKSCAEAMDAAPSEAEYNRQVDIFDDLLAEIIRILDSDPEIKATFDEVIRGMKLEKETNALRWRQSRPAVSEAPVSQQRQTTAPAKAINADKYEIKATKDNVTTIGASPAVHKPDAESEARQRYATYDAIRREAGARSRILHDSYVNELTPPPPPANSNTICRVPAILNSKTVVPQQFSNERCDNSIQKKMPWSVPVVVPGTKIEFQFSLLFYCKVPALTMGDQMSAVAEDYAFVRIINREDAQVRGKVDIEYVDMDGVTQHGFERFVLEPGEKSEDIGMWYLACRFKSITLIEFDCK